MTPEERIDAALESILQHICYDLEHASLLAHNNMREAMRKIMVDEYALGVSDATNDAIKILQGWIKNEHQN